MFQQMNIEQHIGHICTLLAWKGVSYIYDTNRMPSICNVSVNVKYRQIIYLIIYDVCRYADPWWDVDDRTRDMGI